jgi:hypothetical protein
VSGFLLDANVLLDIATTEGVVAMVAGATQSGGGKGNKKGISTLSLPQKCTYPALSQPFPSR